MPVTSEKIKETIASQLGIKTEKVTESAKIADDLGADSLDVIELLSILEDEFGILIPDEDNGKIITVGDLVSYIQVKIEQK